MSNDIHFSFDLPVPASEPKVLSIIGFIEYVKYSYIWEFDHTYSNSKIEFFSLYCFVEKFFYTSIRQASPKISNTDVAIYV